MISPFFLYMLSVVHWPRMGLSFSRFRLNIKRTI